MWKPGKRVCDLCQQTELPSSDDFEGLPPAFIMLPIPEEERFELAQAISEMIPPPLRQIAPVIQTLPTHYRLEFCMGCVDGFMPMIEELRKKGWATVIQQAQRRVARARKEQWKDATSEDAET